MSIEKLSDLSQTMIEQNPYTQLCNNVILHIKNGDAFLVWAYLLSKTRNWKVIKKDIQRQYGFGATKVKQIFSYLKRSNLIQYNQVNQDGVFGSIDIMVLVGTSFKVDEPYLAEKETDDTVGSETDPAVQNAANNRRVENRTCGYATPLLKKDNTKERKDQKLSCASSDARDRFDDFWSIYPKKKGKLEARKVWVKLKLNLLADTIIEKLKQQIEQDVDWKEIKFIKHPERYLKGEHWDDQITKPTPPAVKPPVSAVRTPVNTSNGYANMTDYTEQRLRREAEEAANGKTQSPARDQLGRTGLRSAKDYLLS